MPGCYLVLSSCIHVICLKNHDWGEHGLAGQKKTSTHKVFMADKRLVGLQLVLEWKKRIFWSMIFHSSGVSSDTVPPRTMLVVCATLPSTFDTSATAPASHTKFWNILQTQQLHPVQHESNKAKDTHLDVTSRFAIHLHICACDGTRND